MPRGGKTGRIWAGRRLNVSIAPDRRAVPFYYLDTSGCEKAEKLGFEGSCLNCPFEKCFEESIKKYTLKGGIDEER